MRISFRGHSIVVEREGAGQPLLLVHGLGTPMIWERVREPLSHSFELFVVHLPGFGSSDPAPVPYSVRDHALLVQRILESLGLRDAVLAGISYGAQVAATLAAMAPERVSALVLVCGSGLMRRYRFLRSAALFRIVASAATGLILRNERMIRLISKRLYADPAKQPEALVRSFHRMMLDSRRRNSWFECVRNGAAPDEDFAGNLSAIRMPTLILWGMDDRVIPAHFAEDFHRRIVGSSLQLFSNCGHAVPLEQPEEMCGAINAWDISRIR